MGKRNFGRGKNNGNKGRGGGNGGNSGGKKTNQQPQQQQKKPAKLLFIAHQPGKRPPHTYEAAQNSFIEWCQATLPRGPDIAKSLRKGSRIDLDAEKPALQQSKKAVNADGTAPTSDQLAAATFENKQFEIEHRIEYQAWHKRCDDI